MATNNYIKDAMIRHQVYLGRYSGGISGKIADEAYARLLLVADLIKETAGGIGELVNIQRSYTTIIGPPKTTEIITQSSREIAQLEAEFFESLLDKSTTGAIIQRVTPELLLAAAGNVSVRLSTSAGGFQTFTAGQLCRGFDANNAKQIENAIRGGILLQKNTDDIVDDIMALSKRSQQQARALARTVINQVGADTRESVTLANAHLFEGQQYVATLDSRTTFLCAQYDGQMFDIGQGPMPPLHFNCRSLRVDKVKKQYVIPGLVGNRPAVSLTEDGKRDIKQVGSNTKFEGWFSRQPEYFQRDYLGEGRFELYKSQGLKIGDFVEDNGKILTLDELRGRF